DDLDDSRDRDGEQGAEEPVELHAGEHAYEDHERVEAHRPCHDRDLQYMVLELLIDDVHDCHHYAGRGAVQQGYEDGGDGAQRRAHEGNEVGERHPDGQHEGERHAQDLQADEGDNGGDDTDQQVAGDVPG